jgi:hypothetical protein
MRNLLFTDEEEHPVLRLALLLTLCCALTHYLAVTHLTSCWLFVLLHADEQQGSVARMAFLLGVVLCTSALF